MTDFTNSDAERLSPADGSGASPRCQTLLCGAPAWATVKWRGMSKIEFKCFACVKRNTYDEKRGVERVTILSLPNVPALAQSGGEKTPTKESNP